MAAETVGGGGGTGVVDETIRPCTSAGQEVKSRVTAPPQAADEARSRPLRLLVGFGRLGIRHCFGRRLLDRFRLLGRLDGL